MSIGKFIKDFAPVIIGAATGGAGTGLGTFFSSLGVENPILQQAIVGGLTTKAFGGKDKDAVRNALLSGLGGAFLDNRTTQSVMQDGTNVRTTPTGEKLPFAMTRSEQTVGGGSSPISDKPPIEKALERVQGGGPRTFSGELLKAGGISDDNLLARLLNTRVGEGLTAGLIAQLLAGDDDEERPREFEQRPFGFGGPGGRLGGITFAQDGGPMAFPRRNGGIDPSEGSGTKDDVPAMLMAGEFVLTKDAVKGLGDGNQRKGIQRAYNMMDQLEARA